MKKFTQFFDELNEEGPLQDASHADHPYHSILSNRGYTYSHSNGTPLHHVYKHSALPHQRAEFNPESGQYLVYHKLNGGGMTGNSKEAFDKHLKGRVQNATTIQRKHDKTAAEMRVSREMTNPPKPPDRCSECGRLHATKDH